MSLFSVTPNYRIWIRTTYRLAKSSFVSKSPFRSIGRSKSLQALRALAALLVVLFHVNHSIFGSTKYYLSQPFGSLFEFGHAGVQFFFVLSGFIIYTAHHNDIGDSSKFGAFAWKRFWRVYPAYWIMLLLVAPIYFIMPSFGTGVERDPGVILDAVTLLHVLGSGSIVLSVSWTLFHEILFYGVFSILLLNRRVGWTVLGLWFATSALGSSAEVNPHGLRFYFSSVHLLFGMGISAAWLLHRRVCPAPVAVGLAGLACFFGAAIDEISQGLLSADALNLAYGFGSMLIVAAAVELEAKGMLRAPRVLLFLGNASYSIYLIHFVALSALAKVALIVTHHIAVPHTLLFIGLTAGAIGAGIVYHLLVEVPLLALIGQWSSNRKAVILLPKGISPSMLLSIGSHSPAALFEALPLAINPSSPKVSMLEA